MTALVPEHTSTASRHAQVFHPLTVQAVDRLCDDAVAIAFTVPESLAGSYAFCPGQSLPLRRVIDGAVHHRLYSICSPVGKAPTIGVREIADGLFSPWLVREVVPGMMIEVGTPTGPWRADVALGERHLCIAAGSGITPLLSVTSTALTHTAADVTFVYGNRTSRTVMFVEELGDLKDEYGSRLQIVHVLSREPRDVDLFSGRLDAGRIRRLFSELIPVEVFDQVWLCGPLQMIEDAQMVLAELGVPLERIHVELFYVDTPPPQPRRRQATLTGATTVLTTVLDGVRVTAIASRDATVLDSAQATRGNVPFACKGGVCGTCRAIVREGKVDMHHNYALEPSEVEAGFVLTCQTFPVGDCLTVDYDA